MIAELLTASLVVVVFIVVCIALRLVPVAKGINATAAAALGAMRDAALDDDAKEMAARRAAISLLAAFLSIVWRTVVAVLASLAVIYAADAIGIVAADMVMRRLESWEFIVAATLVVTALYLLLARRRRRAATR